MLHGKFSILENMFIWQLEEICKYVRLTICLSVYLSVLATITHERFDISSPNLVHICTGSLVPASYIDK